MNQYLKLIKTIAIGALSWKRYLDGGTWHGVPIKTKKTTRNQRQNGFTVDYGNGMSTIKYDWEKEEVKVDGQKVKFCACCGAPVII